MGSGCTFIGWTISSTTAYGQGCADSVNQCVFTMNSDIDVEYRFTYTPPATPMSTISFTTSGAPVILQPH